MIISEINILYLKILLKCKVCIYSVKNKNQINHISFNHIINHIYPISFKKWYLIFPLIHIINRWFYLLFFNVGMYKKYCIIWNNSTLYKILISSKSVILYSDLCVSEILKLSSLSLKCKLEMSCAKILYSPAASLLI